MKAYSTTITLLLALLVVSARSLPLNTQNSSENSELDESQSSALDDEQLQQKSSEQQQQSDELTIVSNESVNDEEAEAEAEESPLSESSDSTEENEDADELEKRVVKRSPEIPDPEPYRANNNEDQPEAPSVHSTHDEYLEWKSKQPRFRRDLDDDSSNIDYNDVQPIVVNSLEDYAQGCEVMEENSDENNETTYNDYRRKREVSDESSKETEEEAEAEAKAEAESESEQQGVAQSESEETEITVEEQTAAEGAEESEPSSSAEEPQEVNTEDESIISSAEADAEAQPLSEIQNEDSSLASSSASAEHHSVVDESYEP